MEQSNSNRETTRVDDQLLAELAPTGVLRAAINMSNFLLVTGQTNTGAPDGVSPDMAQAIAAKLGVDCKLIPYPRPGGSGGCAGEGRVGHWQHCYRTGAGQNHRLQPAVLRNSGDLPSATGVSDPDP